jgi:hypothetical protein
MSCATCREKCRRAAPRTEKSDKPAQWTPYFWWAKCHWGEFSFPENLGFPPAVPYLFHYRSS